MAHTNPQPLDLPVFLSVMTTASKMSPNCSKYFLMVSLWVSHARPPTNTLVYVVSPNWPPFAPKLLLVAFICGLISLLDRSLVSLPSLSLFLTSLRKSKDMDKLAKNCSDCLIDLGSARDSQGLKGGVCLQRLGDWAKVKGLERRRREEGRREAEGKIKLREKKERRQGTQI